MPEIADSEWPALIRVLRNVDNADAAVAASERIHKEARAEDVGRLKELLRDQDFFVREAAAWPLSELAGASVLPELLSAYQRGLDEGHDNDGFTAALLEMIEADRAAVRVSLQRLEQSDNREIRENASWLLTFCEPESIN